MNYYQVMKKLYHTLRVFIYSLMPFGRSYLSFLGSVSNRVSFWSFIKYKLSIRGKRIYWPVHKNSEVVGSENIYVGKCSNPGTRPGCYIQGIGKIYIGDYVRFASNIGVVSANHNNVNHISHNNSEVIIGDYSWIGMNSVILPGVILGPRTIVGAGSVVTKSFQEGFCVIAGNPAKVVKRIERKYFVPTVYQTEFYGFLTPCQFSSFYKKEMKSLVFESDINIVKYRSL